MTTTMARTRRPARTRDPLDPSDIAAPDSEKAALAATLDLLDRDPSVAAAAVERMHAGMFVAETTADLFRAMQTAYRETPQPTRVDVLRAIRQTAADNGVVLEAEPTRQLLIHLAEDTLATGAAAGRILEEATADVIATHARRETVKALAAAVAAVRSPTPLIDTLAIARDRLDRLDEIAAGHHHQARRVVLDAANTIEAEPINWLWPQRMSLGSLSIVTGMVGMTKSTLTIDLTARVTNGTKWPDGSGSCPQGDVILVGSEDDPGKVVIPRLAAAGADMSRVHVCRGVQTPNADHLDPLVLERDLELIRKQLDRLPDVRMIVFDPLSEVVHAEENSNGAIRAALNPLVALAQQRNVAIVAVLHQSKKTDLSIVQRIAGASSYGQLARHIIAVMNDPEDHTVGMERRRLMAVIKNSYGEQNVGQRYRVTTRNGCPMLEWLPGVVEIDADQIASRPTGGNHHRDRQSDAVDALREILADGPVGAADVAAQMDERGFSDRLVRRAAGTLGVEKTKTGRTWEWSLPAAGPDPEVGSFTADEWNADQWAGGRYK